MKSKSYLTILLTFVSLGYAFSQFQQVTVSQCDQFGGSQNDYISPSTNNKIISGYMDYFSDPMTGSVVYNLGICSFDVSSSTSSQLRYKFSENAMTWLFCLVSKTDTLYEDVEIVIGSYNDSLTWHTNDFGSKSIKLPINHANGVGIKNIIPTLNNSYIVVKKNIISSSSDSLYFLRVDITNDTSYRTSSINDLDTNSSSHLFFVNDSIGYFVCTNSENISYLKKTTDYTNSWSTVLTDSVNQFTGVYFTSPTDGYIVGTNGLILITADGGSSWQRTIAPVWSSVNTTNVIGDLRSVSFFDSNVGYAGGDAGVLYKTINAGQNWFQIGSNTTQSIVTLSPQNDSILIFKTNTNSLFKNNVQLVSIKNSIKENIEGALFPNPFDSSVNLNKVTGKISSLKIFNALGMNIKTIQNPASVIETKDLQQGIYVFKLILDNGSCSNFKLIKN